MEAGAAAAPVLLVLFLMTVLRWPPARAGVVTAGASLALGVTVFDFGGAQDPFSVPAGVGGVLAEAAFIALTVVAIIGPALGIHHLQQRTGATATLRSGLARLHPDPRLTALMVAWFFTLFLEGAAGFGTPVALSAPFLVALGFRPVQAVAAALVGHAAGVSFGAVGTPVIAFTAVVEPSARELSRAIAPYHLVLGWVLMAVLLVFIAEATGAGPPPWRWGALAAVAFFVPYGLIAALIGPELPTLGGSLVGATVFALALVAHARRRGNGATPAPPLPAAEGADPPDAGRLIRAAAPYLVLVVLVLLTRLIAPVRRALEEVVLAWEAEGAFSGSIRPLLHPALLLTVSFAAGAVLGRASWPDVRGAFVVATGQLGRVLVALVAMVTIARTMSHAGMTSELAGVAARIGSAWPLAAPLVGAVGSFVTGSATASNLLFAELQADTAEVAELPVLPVLGAQGFGAAVGILVAPYNLVAAAATVGLAGSESLVLRRTLPTAALYVTLGGLLALVLAR